MDVLHQQLLNILCASIHGEKAVTSNGLSQEQLPLLFSLARAHKVLPLVYSAAPHYSVRQEAILQMMTQTQKTREFLSLYRHLTDAGVAPLVVKGLVCRGLYPNGDLRPSSDEDLWVSPAEFEACAKAMAAFGMETSDDMTGFEVSFRKADSPLYIELHRSLFNPENDAYGSLNTYFEGAHDRVVDITVDGVTVCTLSPTDHLFYLLCHAYKHFLHSGFGIRQVCDIVLFAQYYESAIDWKNILENCRTIRADLFAAAIFRIGESYLGVPCPAPFRASSIDELPLLEDILSAGVYGGATPERQHSSNMTLSAASGKKKAGLLVSAFPSASQLQGRYPYLKTKPWLLPAAWAQRIFRYSREKSDPSASLDMGRKRIALLKKYGIID